MRTQLWMVGADGSVWNLLAGEQGMTALDGLKGLKLPTFKDVSTVSARLDGQVHRGTRWDPRMVVLPYLVSDVMGDDRTEGDWRALDRAVEQAMSTEDVSWLMVISDIGGYRTLKVRMAGVPTELFTTDPGPSGAQSYSVDLVADQPWYEGIPVEKTFTGAGELATAQVGNPGDRGGWPVFTVYGTGVYSVGCAPDRLTAFGPIAGSAWARYDTNPANPTLTDDLGRNLWPYLGGRPLRAPLPPGPSRPLFLSVTGNASPVVDVEFTPHYGGPW